MNVAVYARVSSQKQAQEGTIEQQLTRLQAHVLSQGWTRYGMRHGPGRSIAYSLRRRIGWRAVTCTKWFCWTS
jgi:DNA invertase Pin-like site-specific DNA recombinase